MNTSIVIEGLSSLNKKLTNLKGINLSSALEKCCIIVENDAKQECPVDTGRLRNSLTHEVDGNDGYVGTNVEYAPYVEFGTYKMDAQPFLQPALNKNSKQIKDALNKEAQKQVKGAVSKP